MKKSISAIHHVNAIVFIMLFLTAAIVFPVSVQSASFTGSRPTLTQINSSYNNSKVHLKWSKVKGAKKYQVFYSSSKFGTYKLFATTNKNYINKKGAGSLYYKVRAVKGKKVSKFSNIRHLFGANSRLTLGTHFYLDNYQQIKITAFRLLITNKTKYGMTFSTGSNQCSVFKVNTKTKKVKRYNAYLLSTGIGEYIPPKETRSIYVYSYDWLPSLGKKDGMREGDDCYMVTASFRAGGCLWALASTNKASDSAIVATLTD